MSAQRLPLITAIVLCLLISGLIYWQAHPIVIPFIKGEPDLASSYRDELMRSENTGTPRSESTPKNYNIAGFKLFGDASAPAKKAPVITEELPETTLKLTLSGVMAGKDNRQASALIEGPDRQTRNYRVDEEVPGGAILKEVHPDRVVLERAGRLENLIFEDTRPIGILQQEVAEADTPQVYVPAAMPEQSAQNLNNFNQQQTQQIKDRLSRLRNRLQSSGQ
jgi:general secretion pathway protein C